MRNRTRRSRLRKILLILALAFFANCGASSSALVPAAAPPPVTGRRNDTQLQARFFIGSDVFMQIVMQHIDVVPKPFRGPILFLMGFTSQNMENIMSTMRSVGQMVISSLVMMAVKRWFFSDLRTEADRNKAISITDAILDIINLIN